MNCQIIINDSVDALRFLPSESIDLVVTSPPYDKLRDYAGHTMNFNDTASQLFRVLKPGGVVCWNVGAQVIDGSESLSPFKQAIHFVEGCGFRLHDTMLYAKLNGSKPCGLRYGQSFEYIFVLSKGRPKAVNLIKDKPNTTAGRTALGRWTVRQKDGTMKEAEYRKTAAEFGVRPNIWLGNTRGQEDMCEALPHPAMMPKWLARDLIVSFSNAGDTVIDCFAGSGTTGVQAITLNRHAILIDADEGCREIMKSELSQVEPLMSWATDREISQTVNKEQTEP